MKRNILAAVFIALVVSPWARAESTADTWDLTPLFASESTWKEEYGSLTRAFQSLTPCKGHLGSSGAMMLKCLDEYFTLQMRLSRLSTWASLQRSADVKNPLNNERSQLADDLGSKFGQETAFFVPELAKLGRPKVSRLVAKTPGLAPYKQFLRSVADQAEHILDPARTQLLATLAPVVHTGHDIHSLMISADIPWPTIELSTGKAKIDTAGYTLRRESAKRSDREKVFTSFYGTLNQYEGTLGATLANSVKTNVIMAKIQHYKNPLDAALEREKIPESVYHTLVSQVNSGLPVLHRYLRHIGSSLGIKKLEYFDAYVAGGDLAMKIPLAQAKAAVLEALAPLGPDYVKRLSDAFSQRWMDVYPREGKVNGAFMEGAAYQVHPFLLLNHQDNFESMSTLAHEWGHAMHTVFTTGSQPYVNADYSIFIAEIASILNEVLLHEKLIKDAKTPEEKKFYLEAMLKMIRGTFYRQTQFAEFELALHDEVDHGGALTGQKISAIYGGIARKYYGHDQGVMNFDKRFFSEWVFVPHFYNSFYVYQYATCMAAAFYFADQILTNVPGARENYLNVLKAGSSKYPYEILKDAGVDMADPKVYKAVVRRAELALNQLGAPM
jgi:oligoendopeptidase F